MSSREPSGLRMYDAALWVELVNGRRGVDVRASTSVWTGVAENRSGGESLQEARSRGLPLVLPTLVKATRFWRLFDAHTRTLPMFIRHTYLFNASATDVHSIVASITIDIWIRHRIYLLSVASPTSRRSLAILFITFHIALNCESKLLLHF